MNLAFVRSPARSIVNACELTFLKRQPIDFTRIVEQHDAYCMALREAGLDVRRLQSVDALPDSVFVEDAAIVLDEAIILTRPGAPSREPEVELLAASLREHRSTPLRIVAPGTLDGGDVLRIGRRIFVGQSARTNRAGFEQLRSLCAPLGYSTIGMDVGASLHLKTALTALDETTVLLNPDWIDPSLLHGLTLIPIHRDERFAANVLALEHALIVNSAFPRTLEVVARHAAASGKRLIPVDISEFGKAEAGLTCLSLVLRC